MILIRHSYIRRAKILNDNHLTGSFQQPDQEVLRAA